MVVKNKKPLGYSLIELLIVVAILIGLAAAGASTYRGVEQRLRLNAEADQLVATLEKARTKTLSSDQQYGVYFEDTRYTLFRGSLGQSDDEVHHYSEGVSLASYTLSGPTVLFSRVQGEPSVTGTVTLRVTNNPGVVETVTIAPTGLAGTRSDEPTGVARVTDSRHVHLALNWSIQGASNLQFAYAGGPTVVVPMASYFSGGQTSFAWDDTINTDQTLAIQTHSLTAGATTLSVWRPLDRNDKAVTISIDGKDIISYAVDGTATKGAWATTMTLQ